MASAVMGLPQGNVEQVNEKVTVVPHPDEESRTQTANNDAVVRESAMSTSKASDDSTVTKRGEHKSYAGAVNGETNGTDGTNGTHLVNGINGSHDDDPYPSLAETGSDGRYETQAWRAGGVRFAPLRIPLKRRLQTAAVLLHSMSIVVMVAMFWFTCANPLSWPILIPYLLHLLFSNAAADGKLSYRSEYLRSLPLWRLFAGYFPAKLHKTYDLDPNRRYILGYHPHGIISHGAWCAFATNALNFKNKFPGITNSLLTLDSNFRIPFYRDWILGMGIRSVSKESIRNTLGKGGPKNDGQGRAVTIVIGGARESLEAHPGTLRLILKSRKGFVKMALRTGADLVPVIGFGENDLYDQLSPKTHPGVHKFQMFTLRVFKFTLPGFHGRGLLNYDVGLMPYRRSVNIVVGKPIRIDTEPGHEPTQEEIDLYHGHYVDELEKLWASYKDQFSPGRVSEMEIFA